MDILSILGLGGAILLLYLKPGPDLIALISKSISDGPRAGIVLYFGGITAQCIYAGFAAFSYSFSPDIVLFLEILFKSLGAAMFIYMGIKGLQNLQSGKWKRVKVEKSELLENYFTGLAIAMGNPIVFFFYTALLPTFINMAFFTIWHFIYVCVMILIFNFGPAIITALLAGRVKEVLKDSDTLIKINFITSCLFILLGLFIGATAITQFDVQALYFSAQGTTATT